VGDGRALEAVFVDFGGTLMPSALPMTAELEQWRARSLSGVLGPDPAKAAAVIEAIETAALAAAVDRPPTPGDRRRRVRNGSSTC